MSTSVPKIEGLQTKCARCKLQAFDTGRENISFFDSGGLQWQGQVWLGHATAGHHGTVCKQKVDVEAYKAL